MNIEQTRKLSGYSWTGLTNSPSQWSRDQCDAFVQVNVLSPLESPIDQSASTSLKNLCQSNPRKSSFMLPIANILPTSLLVPINLTRKWVPFSMT